jgi:SAM-dependent methyltransferase
LPETFQPIAVQSPDSNKLLFILRCLVDLQLLTIYRFLAVQLKTTSGRLLDVGAGQSPWRGMLASGTQYTGVDVYQADEFGMDSRQDIILYDGKVLPFVDAEFDGAMCIEVLEHVPNPQDFLREVHRVLRLDGKLFLTVPWSARIHHMPHDYYRFTRFGLDALLRASGFGIESIDERGNDIATVANKLIVVQLRLLNIKEQGISALWRFPLGIFIAPVTAAFIAAAHVSFVFGFGSEADPLGYAVVARKI